MDCGSLSLLCILMMSYTLVGSCLGDELTHDDHPSAEHLRDVHPGEAQYISGGRRRLLSVEGLDESGQGFQALTGCSALDCSDIRDVYGNAVGIHSIWRGDNSPPFDALCHQDADGAWMVIQRRVDGSENFNRPWTDYKEGFGTLGFNSEFWLGLEKMHEISKLRRYVLRVELMDWDGNRASADYSDFYVDDENHDYTLHVGSFLGGTAGDSLTTHNNMKFTTPDQDNDVHETIHCGQYAISGWWFARCHPSDLNGPYLRPPAHTNTWNGTIWHSWHNTYSMKESSMKIKPAA